MEKLKKESKNSTHIRGVLHYFNFAKKIGWRKGADLAPMLNYIVFHISSRLLPGKSDFSLK